MSVRYIGVQWTRAKLIYDVAIVVGVVLSTVRPSGTFSNPLDMVR